MILSMSDLERLSAIFNELSIGYSIEDSNGGYMVDGKIVDVEDGKKLKLEANQHANVIGYNGFVSEYHFDKKGKFVSVGIWEE